MQTYFVHQPMRVANREVSQLTFKGFADAKRTLCIRPMRARRIRGCKTYFMRKQMRVAIANVLRAGANENRQRIQWFRRHRKGFWRGCLGCCDSLVIREWQSEHEHGLRSIAKYKTGSSNSSQKLAHLLDECIWLLHGLFPGFGGVFARSLGPHILESPLTRAHKKGSTNRTKGGVTGVLRRVGRDWEG